MKTRADARALARWLVDIAQKNGVRTEALLTAMDAPLGGAVGNANEVIEAIETLKGRGPTDLEVLSVRLAARMLVLSGVETDDMKAEGRVREAIASGAGLEVFRATIEAQGGDPRVIDDYARLPRASHESPWCAPHAGYVARIDAEAVGRAAVVLGAGRDRADAGVDHGVGIAVVAPVGTQIRAGAPILLITCDDPARVAAAERVLDGAIAVTDEAPPLSGLILETIN
jgi:thymidine phosphorylase